MRKLGYRSHASYETYRGFLRNPPRRDVVANIAICLIHQANFLLDRQIRAAWNRIFSKTAACASG